MEPSDEQIVAFATLGDIKAWLVIPGAEDDATTVWGSLMHRLGATDALHPRMLGAMSKEDYTACLEGWKIGEHDPTPVQRTMSALLGDTARICVGAQRRKADIEKEERERRVADEAYSLALAKATPPLPPPTVSSNAMVKTDRTVKLSQVISQTADQEIPILSEVEVAKAYKTYFDIFKVMPPANAELAIEQLTGLHFLLTRPSKPVPYVDFAVWCPMWHRNEKKVKLTGMSFDSSGQLKQVEVFGPADFELWEESHDCLKTGILMFSAVDLGWIDLYHKKQQKYARRYGRAVWHIQ